MKDLILKEISQDDIKSRQTYMVLRPNSGYKRNFSVATAEVAEYIWMNTGDGPEGYYLSPNDKVYEMPEDCKIEIGGLACQLCQQGHEHDEPAEYLVTTFYINASEPNKRGKKIVNAPACKKALHNFALATSEHNIPFQYRRIYLPCLTCDLYEEYEYIHDYSREKDTERYEGNCGKFLCNGCGCPHVRKDDPEMRIEATLMKGDLS